MSLDSRVVGILAARQAEKARRVEDADAEARAAARSRMTRVVRGMNDLFEAVAEVEGAWRLEVYRGERPYTVEDDAAAIRLYRDWAGAASSVARSAARYSTPERPMRGLGRLRRRLAEVARRVDDPSARLIDFPPIGREVDPAILGVRPLSEFLAEHPEHAEAAEAADRTAASGDAALVSISDYLLARGTR